MHFAWMPVPIAFATYLSTDAFTHGLLRPMCRERLTIVSMPPDWFGPDSGARNIARRLPVPLA